MLDKRDSQGRQFIAMHDVRGAIVTGFAVLNTGTITQLVAGDTDYFLDVIELMCSNNSTVGVGIDLVNDGSIKRHIDIPASTTLQFQFDAPLKQQTKSVPWNVDMDDVTGTTVQVGAMFIKKDGK